MSSLEEAGCTEKNGEAVTRCHGNAWGGEESFMRGLWVDFFPQHVNEIS